MTIQNEYHDADDGTADKDVVMRLRSTNVVFEMDRGTSHVVDDVDLDVYRGEILGLVGESGSGKSMLASSMLDAVIEPGQTDGGVTFVSDDGEEVDVLGLSTQELRHFRWETVSMVFQGAMNSFNPVLNIRSHFKETLEAHDSDEERGMERAHQILSDLYLDSDRVLDSYPHELSGGMKQRALIALSLILEPEVLVMDEPTAALDLLMQRSIITLLEDIQQKYDLTMIFITHDLPLIGNLADRIAVMYASELMEVGPTRSVVKEALHPYTRALLNATPNIHTAINEIGTIEGSSPDPINRPAGCSYHPRCPLSDEKCANVDPDLTEIEEDHMVSCFYPKKSKEEIPLVLGEEGVYHG